MTQFHFFHQRLLRSNGLNICGIVTCKYNPQYCNKETLKKPVLINNARLQLSSVEYTEPMKIFYSSGKSKSPICIAGFIWKVRKVLLTKNMIGSIDAQATFKGVLELNVICACSKRLGHKTSTD